MSASTALWIHLETSQTFTVEPGHKGFSGLASVTFEARIRHCRLDDELTVDLIGFKGTRPIRPAPLGSLDCLQRILHFAEVTDRPIFGVMQTVAGLRCRHILGLANVNSWRPDPPGQRGHRRL